MKIFTFAAKKIDSKLKPANIDDIRWFVVLVLVDYCLVKVYLSPSPSLICTIVFPLISILYLEPGAPEGRSELKKNISVFFISNVPSSTNALGSLGAALL